MKIACLFLCSVMCSASCLAYTLDDVFKLPEWKTDHGWFNNTNRNERVRAYSIIIGPKETVLWIELQATSRSCKRLEYYASRNAYLEVGGARLPYVGSRSNGKLHWTTDENGKPEGWGWNNPEEGKSDFYNMVFQGSIPLDDGFDTIALRDPGQNGCYGYGMWGFRLKPDFSGIKTCKMSEMDLRKQFSEKCQPLEGIYETADEKSWRVACVKQSNGTYEIEFLENGFHEYYWFEGDIKAVLRPTATPGLFKAKWWNQAFQVLNGVLISFDGATMKVACSGFPFLDNGTTEMVFLKMFPNSAKASTVEAKISEGTGFALRDGYFGTNHHVIDGASDVRIWREIGGTLESSSARIIASDKDADLALLKSSFTCTNIPYSIARDSADVGESVFALGFPLVETMGKELKLTTGVISSDTGFMGDRSNYQVSAAIQPGNSGGPLFNDKGVLVGVVVAKHLGAENANYAIKSSVLRRFLKEHFHEQAIPTGSTRQEKTLTDKVKVLREYVYRIECLQEGTFSTGMNAAVDFPEVDEPYKTATLAGTIMLTKVSTGKDERGRRETVLEFSSKALDGCWLSPRTFLQYGDMKLYLRKVVGLPTDKKDKSSIPDDWQVRTFKAYFPPVPEGVEKVDFIEPAEGDGTPFVWRGIHLK